MVLPTKEHTMHQLIRVESPAIVEAMAEANHVEPKVNSHAASVTLGEVVYFWAAA